MALIDTHTHLYQPAFDGDRDEAMARCAEAGVNTLLLPNIDCASIPRVHATDQWPDRCLGMMDSPCHVKDGSMEQELTTIATLRNSGRRYVAWAKSDRPILGQKPRHQHEAFERQVAAKELGLPIVIHVREAFDEPSKRWID